MRGIEAALLGLGMPDAMGLRLPPGFSARIVARSGHRVVPDQPFVWHPAPDGGATFALPDGGWIYVSNSELGSGQGGASALRFASDGTILSGRSILRGTESNCAGGRTPWGTWLSCEETDRGRVWECDPLGNHAAQVRPALGRFRHEAVAVDPPHHLYLSEDERDGRLYRYTPADWNHGIANLDAGVLEVALVAGTPGGAVSWERVADPSASSLPTRRQVPRSRRFFGGEGLCLVGRTLYLSTKGDNRVWALDLDHQHLTVLYDDAFFAHAALTGVDNLTASAAGDLYVAEDAGDMQIIVLTRGGRVVPVVEVTRQANSEVTGPAFDPSGTRLYFSSQRGRTGDPRDGITYEVTGPFIQPDDG